MTWLSPGVARRGGHGQLESVRMAEDVPGARAASALISRRHGYFRMAIRVAVRCGAMRYEHGPSPAALTATFGTSVRWKAEER